MTRDELTLAIAGALTGAVLIGWVLHWIFARLSRDGRARPDEASDLASRLVSAEAARDAAERRRDEALARLAESEVERDAALRDRDAAQGQAEDVRRAYRAAMGGRDAF